MYLHAWKSGLKTTYYLRSRPATRINKTTTGGDRAPTTPDGRRRRRRRLRQPKQYTDEEAVACSLENPETCEACQ